MAEERNEEKPGERSQAKELEKLRADNEAMKVQLETKKKKRGGFWRSLLVWFLVVLACVFSLCGALSVWVQTTTLNTNSFVGTIAPLVKNEAVADATTDIAVKELFKAYNIEGQIRTGLDELSKAIDKVAPKDLELPDINLSFIAGPISSGLQDFAKTAAKKFLQSEVFYKTWEKSLRLAHETTVNIIKGKKGELITSKGDTVVLDLGELLKQVKAELVKSGLGFLEKVEVPADLGQFELFKAEQLGMAKSLVRLLDLLSWVLPLLALIFFVLGVVAAKDRRKALMGAGIGLAITMLIVLIVLKVAHGQLLGKIEDAGILAAANVVWGTVLGGLKQAIWGLLVFGVVVAAGSAVAGPYKWAVWLREHVADFFKNWRERRGADAEARGALAAFVDGSKWWFRAGGLVVAIIVLVFLPSISALAIILTVVILAIYLAAVELLR